MLSRRTLLSGLGSSVLALGAATPAARLLAQQPTGMSLPRLPRIDATTSNSFALTASAGETAFYPGVPSPTLGFNGNYLGPVIRVRTGNTIAAKVENQTGDRISVHWHGLLVPGDVDGGPHQGIAAGETWTPELPIVQPPATLWYHSHIHRETAEKVYAGLAGVLIVEDGADADRGLPATPEVDDLVLVIQDKRFDGNGRTAYWPGPPDLMHGFLGNGIVVNGTPNPVATVPPGIVRLRLLNASNARIFDLFFADGRSFHLAGTEQGLLPRPIPLRRLRLATGERAEILVDFADGAPAGLISAPHVESGGMGMMFADYFVDPYPVIDFAVDTGLPVDVRTIPTTVDIAGEDATAEPTLTRHFVLDDFAMMGRGMMGGMGRMRGRTAANDLTDLFGINGRSFDMARINEEIARGTTERWIVRSQMLGHAFHVHGVRFRVESENGGPPQPHNRGWKDTVFIDGEVSLTARFDHPASHAAPYMFHCHILEHEDNGMMGQFTVT